MVWEIRRKTGIPNSFTLIFVSNYNTQVNEQPHDYRLSRNNLYGYRMLYGQNPKCLGHLDTDR